MRNDAVIAVIIPALNEQDAIGKVLADIPGWVDRIIVVDNGSTDTTADIARDHGAVVLHESERGYGAACLAGLEAIDDADVVVFLDGDYSDDPFEMERVVAPILNGNADMVIGSRVLGKRERGALTPQARFGNRLACALIRMIWRVHYTDLGPFRAIRAHQLRKLGMADRDFGWTVEMQVKAAKRSLRIAEVPVSYRRRIGKSKISGTVKGVIAAGAKILYTIAREAVSSKRTMPLSRERLIVFTRYPVSGETKTRLIPALGAEGAAALQRAMTEHIVAIARAFQDLSGAEIVVCYSGTAEKDMTDWLGGDLLYQPQTDGDLGTRMYMALRRSQLAGIERTVLIGADCPGITTKILESAFRKLHDHDIVFGPTVDGGYYLIGVGTPCRSVFQGIAWSTESVLEQSLVAAEIAELRIATAEQLRDIDTPEDLDAWENLTRRRASGHH